MMDALDRVYREQSLSIRARSLRDLQKIWPLLNVNNMGDTFAPWASAVATLIQRDRRLVSGLAASYIRATRLESGVSGDPKIIVSAAAPETQIATSLEVTALAGYRTALRYYPEEKAKQVAFVRTAGAVGRLVLNGGRDTVFDSIRADSRAGGWMRITAPGACSFCQMIAGRGAVYSADTALFGAHDHCACLAKPAYGPTAQKVKKYTPSQRNRSAKTRALDNARAREFMRGGLSAETQARTGRRSANVEAKDIDAARSVAGLKETLAELEKSALKWSSPGTERRIAELRRKIYARS